MATNQFIQASGGSYKFLGNLDLSTASSVTGGAISGVTALQFTTGAAANYILTSDGSGNASWQTNNGGIAGSDLRAIDNSATGLKVVDNGGVPETYLTFDTTNGAQKIILGQDLALGANAVSGSNVSITGGSATGLTSFQLTTGATVGYILTSDGSGNASWANPLAASDSGWNGVTSNVYTNPLSNNVIIGANAPLGTEKVRITGGAFLIDNTTGAVPVSGSGTRLMWAPAKAALRAGAVTGAQWDNASVGQYSIAFGSECTASGNAAFATGNSTTASGNQATAFGIGTTSSGTASLTTGTSNTASATNAVALGSRATAIFQNQFSLASGRFAVDGDAQTSIHVLRATTTNATETEITMDGAAVGASNVFTLAANTCYMGEIKITARRTDATDESAGFIIKFTADQQATAATSALVGGYELTTISKDNAVWAVALSVNTTSGALQFKVTGEAAKTIHWVGRLEITKVG